MFGALIKSKKSHFNKWLNNKFLPFANKVGNQTHLSAIRDSFAMITPLIIAGAFAVLVNQVFFGNSSLSIAHWIAIWVNSAVGYDAAGNIIFNQIGQDIVSSLSQIGAFVWNGSYNVLSILICLVIGFMLGVRRNAGSPIIVSVVALSTFFVAGGSDNTFFGTTGLFGALIISFLSAEFFIFLTRFKKIQIRLPEQVPPSVSAAFSQMIPVILTVLLFGTVSVVFFWIPSNFAVFKNPIYQPWINSWDGTKYNLQNIPNAIRFGMYNNQPLTLVAFVYVFFSYPFLTLSESTAGGLGIAVLYITFVSIFWFFGLHGSNIMGGLFAPIFLLTIVQNTNAFISGQNVPNIITKPFFDGFIMLGGWGASLSLLFMTFIMGRNKQAREVSKLAIVPGLFNINEPVTFAYPLMLNTLLFLPALFGPLLITIYTFLLMYWNLVPKTKLLIPWISPLIIGGLLATLSWQGAVLPLVNFLFGILVYWPFLILANRQAKLQDQYIELKRPVWYKKVFRKSKSIKSGDSSQNVLESAEDLKVPLAKTNANQEILLDKKLQKTNNGEKSVSAKIIKQIKKKDLEKEANVANEKTTNINFKKLKKCTRRKNIIISIVCKKSNFGGLVTEKWKLMLGSDVVGELPTKALALERAIIQAKSSGVDVINIIDEHQNKNIYNIKL